MPGKVGSKIKPKNQRKKKKKKKIKNNQQWVAWPMARETTGILKIASWQGFHDPPPPKGRLTRRHSGQRSNKMQTKKKK